MDMTWAARLLVLFAIVATGCGRTRDVARDAAVTTFRVIDAPANFVRRKIDQQEGETTTTTTTTTSQAAVGSSDVITPGRPLPPRPQGAPGVQPNAGNAAVAGATPRPPRRETATTNVPPPQRTTPPATTEQFPTARPVPDKPGFVYSVDPKGGIIDVTGYQSGDKAKDPYTKQIFIVP